MLPYAIGSRCVRCGEVILPGQEIDLDHVDSRNDQYAGWSHAACNRPAEVGYLRAARSRMPETGVASKFAADGQQLGVRVVGAQDPLGVGQAAKVCWCSGWHDHLRAILASAKAADR